MADITEDMIRAGAIALAGGPEYFWEYPNSDRNRQEFRDRAGAVLEASAALAVPVAVDEEKLAEVLDGEVGWEELGWDDRKDLASLFQDSCALPADGLSEGFYSAVIAVANRGYQRAREHVEAAAYDSRNRLGGF